jgi:hypothetical protein
MNTKRIRELCHAVSFDDLDRSSRQDILEILLAEEDRLTAPTAPVAPPTAAGPTTGSPSVTMEEIADMLRRSARFGPNGAVEYAADCLRSIGVTVLPDAGKE